MAKTVWTPVRAVSIETGSDTSAWTTSTSFMSCTAFSELISRLIARI